MPVFLVLKSMSLTDTLLGLIIPAFPTAFGTFLMRQYFLGMPKDLGEAAMLDGAGPWRTFRSVYAPLAAPGLAIVGVLAFNYHWNEFFRPLILDGLTTSPELQGAVRRDRHRVGAGPTDARLITGQARRRTVAGGVRPVTMESSRSRAAASPISRWGSATVVRGGVRYAAMCSWSS
ncbi:hypothetical protein SVIOM74S_06802 [Streptomyces violarus]